MSAEPPRKAVGNGHDLEWDPPAAMTAALRWTCRTCGGTAINYRGNEYGDALDQPCATGATAA